MIEFDPYIFVPVIRRAGEGILSKYRLQNEITWKEDRSPLTVADRLSHAILMEGLKEIAPELPILSEEGEQYPYDVRTQWPYYFLIDPLDGTKGFIRRTDEFSINIALIHGNRCILGLVHIPVRGVTYVAASGKGAFRISGDHIETLPIVKNANGPVKIVMSRDDASPAWARVMQMIGPTESLRISSSIKFCLLSEGSADFYPRQIGSMEWDIAPGSVLLQESGGKMCLFSGEPVTYNRPDLLNPPFVAMSSAFLQRFPDWQSVLRPFNEASA